MRTVSIDFAPDDANISERGLGDESLNEHTARSVSSALPMNEPLVHGPQQASPSALTISFQSVTSIVGRPFDSLIRNIEWLLLEASNLVLATATVVWTALASFFRAIASSLGMFFGSRIMRNAGWFLLETLKSFRCTAVFLRLFG